MFQSPRILKPTSQIFRYQIIRDENGQNPCRISGEKFLSMKKPEGQIPLILINNQPTSQQEFNVLKRHEGRYPSIIITNIPESKNQETLANAPHTFPRLITESQLLTPTRSRHSYGWSNPQSPKKGSKQNSILRRKSQRKEFSQSQKKVVFRKSIFVIDFTNNIITKQKLDGTEKPLRKKIQSVSVQETSNPQVNY